jgi:hypothetical protein
MRLISSAWLQVALVSTPFMFAAAGCGSDSENKPPPQTGGTAGSAGASGRGGTGGSAGTAGASGRGGASGSGGAGGSGGASGTAGRGGSAGTAGTAGSSGSGGNDASADATVDSSMDATIDAGGDAVADAPADTAADAHPACRTTPVDATFTAHLQITADNECEVFVNGTSVGTTNNWGVAVTIDVTLFLHPGRKNAIAVRGTNTSSQAGNDRGIIGHITIDSDAGRMPLVYTDSSWRVAGTEQTGWTAVDFNDSVWTAAVEIASNGDPPWGTTLSTNSAKWIWSALVPASTNDKPNLETAYARRVFYVAPGGTTVTSGPGCP